MFLKKALLLILLALVLIIPNQTGVWALKLESKDFFTVKFYGVRGSHPTPTIENMEYGGNTSCVVIKINNQTIIIDAGTGIINFGNDIIKEKESEPIKLLMLFSHSHHDHIQGFPFFKPIYRDSSIINIYGPETAGMDFSKILDFSMFTPFFPVNLKELKAQININNIKEGEIIVIYSDKSMPEVLNSATSQRNIPEDAIKISCLKNHAHPKEGVIVFRIDYKGKSIVYASDKETNPEEDKRLKLFAKNTDVLIHDTQYTKEDYASKKGFGHSTPETAVEIAKSAKIKKLIMFHFDPSYNDKKIREMEKNTKELFPETYAAYEKMEIKLLPE